MNDSVGEADYQKWLAKRRAERSERDARIARRDSLMLKVLEKYRVNSLDDLPKDALELLLR